MIQKKSFPFLITGIVLFLLYFLQHFLDIRWGWLNELQQHQGYKRWSGFVLSLFILYQWILTLFRVIKKLQKFSIKQTQIHKWIGVLSPIFFYFHALEIGYGYLALLTYIFFINMLLGTLNLDVIRSTKEWIFQWWMIVHVSLSIIITFITIFHIGVVFYYQ